MGCGTITTHKAAEAAEEPEAILESDPPTDHRKHSSKAGNELFVVLEESPGLEQSPSQSRLDLPSDFQFEQTLRAGLTLGFVN